MGTRRMVLLAVMVAQALILQIIENFIAIPQIVPGVKLGLANIITLVVIIHFSFRDALMVVAVRCILSSFFGGGFVVFLFSITGGVLSAVVMYILYSRLSKHFSIIGVSIGGAITHNFGQILMAAFVMKTQSVFGYLPVLLVSGIIMGCFVGICSMFLSKALKRIGVV